MGNAHTLNTAAFRSCPLVSRIKCPSDFDIRILSSIPVHYV